MLNLFRKILVFGTVLLTVIVFNAAANACSCYPAGTVDKEFAKTPNVLVAKLQSVKRNDGEPAQAFLSVEKIFKGDVKIAEVLTFRFENCSLFFGEEEIGGEFLLYLGDRQSKDDFWRAPGCSRSGAVNDRKNDLRYLENEAKLRGKTRLSGKIVKWVTTLDEFVEHSASPLANRKIRVVGNGKTVTLTTDETGAFEVYDLAPGKYKIYPGRLDGFTFQEEKSGFEEIEITAKSQTEKDIFYSINNAISGKIVDRAGKPVNEICVDLYSVKMQKPLGAFHNVCTEEDGKFEISAIPEGTYKIVVNGESRFDLRSRSPLFETFYYPNVETLEKAAEISVGENFFLRNLVLVPPAQPEMSAFSGKVIFADGKPAAGQIVVFLTEDQISDADLFEYDSVYEAETDNNGEFTIKLPKGREGILRTMFYYSKIADKDRDCAEIEELAKAKENDFWTLESNRFVINKDSQFTGIELKFPFSDCKKAKID